MSMINDALRRASDAAKSAGGGATMSLPSMHVSPPPLPTAPSEFSVPPVPSMDNLPPESEYEEESENKSARKPIIVVLIVILGIGGVMGFKYWKRKQAAKLADIVMNAAKPNTVETKTVLRTASASAAPNGASPVSAPAVPIARETVAPAVATPAPVPAVAAVPVKFPTLRLQSIFYRPSNPSVMINGKTLFITDEIQGVTIADISPASVTLVLSGQTNILTLR